MNDVSDVSIIRHPPWPFRSATGVQHGLGVLAVVVKRRPLSPDRSGSSAIASVLAVCAMADWTSTCWEVGVARIENRCICRRWRPYRAMALERRMRCRLQRTTPVRPGLDARHAHGFHCREVSRISVHQPSGRLVEARNHKSSWLRSRRGSFSSASSIMRFVWCMNLCRGTKPKSTPSSTGGCIIGRSNLTA
jgi:hypothetical protein